MLVSSDHLDLDTSALTGFDSRLDLGPRRVHDADQTEEGQVVFNDRDVFHVFAVIKAACEKTDDAHGFGTHAVVHFMNAFQIFRCDVNNLVADNL